MKIIPFLFLSFFIPTAIADEATATNETVTVNEAPATDEDAQNDSLFSDAVRELDLSISGSKNTQNPSAMNNDMSEHDISTDITTESRIIFEESPIYDPHVYFYRGGTLYSTGRYCDYPYPHIRSFGDCPYYQRFGFQMRFRDVPSAREIYLDKLFNAAYLGNTEAQFKLGVRYRRGMGVSQNLKESYAWFNVALEYGYNPAQYMIDQLMEQMSVHQVEEGSERASELVEDIYNNRRERHERLEKLLSDYPDYSEFNETDNQ